MSVIFQPFKVLGIYSSSVPFFIYKNDKNQNFIYSPVGRTYNIFRFSDLALIGTSDPIEHDITSICGWSNRIYCSAYDKIYSYVRGKKIHKCYSYGICINWKLVEVINDILCGVDGNNLLVCWKIEKSFTKPFYTYQGKENIVKIIKVDGTKGNIVMIAYENGIINLLDIINQKIVYEKQFENRTLTNVIQCPNFVTFAIGCDDGSILFCNTSNDEIFYMNQDQGGIKSLYLCEEKLGDYLLIIGTEFGHLSGWKMRGNKWRQEWQHRNAHVGSVTKMVVLKDGDKVFGLSSGVDNSLRSWKFDGAGGAPREKLSRRGHSGQIRSTNWWPEKIDGSWRIISGGSEGRVWEHVVSGAPQSRTWAAKVTNPVKSVVCNSLCKGNWTNVAACHDKSNSVSCWPSINPLQAPKLTPQLASSPVLTIDMSHCGNFIIAGYECGAIAMFNLQSGLQKGLVVEAHDGPVSKLICLPYSSYFVSCSSANCYVYRWKINDSFKTDNIKFDSKIIVGAQNLLTLVADPSGKGICVSSNDKGLYLISSDNSGMKIVRSFQGPNNTDTNKFGPCQHMVISRFDNLLIAAFSNSIVVYDFVSIKVVDCFMMPHDVTSLSLSPDDSFLSVTITGDQGVTVYLNKLCAGMVNNLAEVNLNKICRMSELADSESEESNVDLDSESEDDVGNEADEVLDTTGGVSFSTGGYKKIRALLGAREKMVENKMNTVGMMKVSEEFFIDMFEDEHGKLRKRQKPIELTDSKEDKFIGGSGDLSVQLLKLSEKKCTFNKLSAFLDQPSMEHDLACQIGTLEYLELSLLMDVIIHELQILRRVDLCVAVVGLVLTEHQDRLLEVEHERKDEKEMKRQFVDKLKVIYEMLDKKEELKLMVNQMNQIMSLNTFV